jgi:hypothetical protein
MALSACPGPEAAISECEGVSGYGGGTVTLGGNREAVHYLVIVEGLQRGLLLGLDSGFGPPEKGIGPMYRAAAPGPWASPPTRATPHARTSR